MPWWNDTQTYYQWPALHFPIHTRQMEIEYLAIKCAGCGKPIRYLHGQGTEHSQCTTVRCAGLCPSCKLITYAQFRVYADHILWESSRGWRWLAMRKEPPVRAWWALGLLILALLLGMLCTRLGV